MAKRDIDWETVSCYIGVGDLKTLEVGCYFEEIAVPSGVAGNLWKWNFL